MKNVENYLSIELYYIDSTICGRAKESIELIDQCISDLEEFINKNDITVVFQEIELKNEEEALLNNIEISPTIRINNMDLILEKLSGKCDYCSTVLDEEVNCSEWEYNGLRFNVIPKPLIIEAIKGSLSNEVEKYLKKVEGIETLSENMKNYFILKKEYEKNLINLKTEKKSCCSDGCF